MFSSRVCNLLILLPLRDGDDTRVCNDMILRRLRYFFVSLNVRLRDLQSRQFVGRCRSGARVTQADYTMRFFEALSTGERGVPFDIPAWRAPIPRLVTMRCDQTSLE